MRAARRAEQEVLAVRPQGELHRSRSRQKLLRAEPGLDAVERRWSCPAGDSKRRALLRVDCGPSFTTVRDRRKSPTEGSDDGALDGRGEVSHSGVRRGKPVFVVRSQA